MQQQTVGILEECRCVTVVLLGVFCSLWQNLFISHGFQAAVGHLNFSFNKFVQKINVFLIVVMYFRFFFPYACFKNFLKFNVWREPFQ